MPQKNRSAGWASPNGDDKQRKTNDGPGIDLSAIKREAEAANAEGVERAESVDAVWMVVAVQEGGGETLVAMFDQEQSIWKPMVSTNRETTTAMWEFAKATIKGHGRPVRLLCFRSRDVEGEQQP